MGPERKKKCFGEGIMDWRNYKEEYGLVQQENFG